MANEKKTTDRLFKKTVQQGHSKRRGEAYFLPYVEPLSAARTPLDGLFNSQQQKPCKLIGSMLACQGFGLVSDSLRRVESRIGRRNF